MEERLELLQNSPGDTETSIAIEKIYQEHRRLVLKICIGILHDKESAEDAFQSTFLNMSWSHSGGRTQENTDTTSVSSGTYRVRMSVSATGTGGSESFDVNGNTAGC